MFSGWLEAKQNDTIDEDAIDLAIDGEYDAEIREQDDANDLRKMPMTTIDDVYS